MRPRGDGQRLLRLFVLVACIWAVLLSASIREAPIWIPFAICCALGLSTLGGPRDRAPARLALGALSGACAVGPALHLLAAAGLALGLPAPGAPAPPIAAGTWLAVAILAPVFEEIVYRGALLEELARQIGAGSGSLITSALFAIPHANAWAVPACFGLGLLLAGVRVRGGSLALVIGCHAGLNGAGLFAVCFPGSARVLLHPALGAVGLATLGIGAWRYGTTRLPTRASA